MSTVTYTFYLDNAGQAATGLQPTFDTFIDLDATATEETTQSVAANIRPNIRELGDGFYMYQIDYATVFTGDAYLVKIDGGENVFSAAAQRYIIMKLERHDSLHNMVQAVTNSSEAITTSTNELLKFIKRLLEVEKGTWKIDTNTNELVIYSTDGGSGNSAYETETSAGTILARYNLLDANNVATHTNPMQRVLNTLEPLPND